MIPVKKVKSPRVIWKELEARGVPDVLCAQLAVGDRIVGLAGMGDDARLVYADSSGVHDTELARAGWRGLALRDDGGAVLVHGDDAIAEVEIPSGRARRFSAVLDGPIKDVAYTLDDVAVLVAVKRHAVLHLMQRDGDALETVAKHVFEEFIFGFGGSAGVLVATRDVGGTSYVLDARHGALRVVDTLKPRLNTVHTSAGKLLVSGSAGTFEIDPADVLR